MNVNAEILKKQTQSKHKKLDQHPILKNLLCKSVKVEDYYHFLVLHYKVHSLLDQNYKLACQKYQFSYYSKVHLLEKDILYLKTKHDLKTPYLKGTNLQIPSPSLALIYVLEGARHGNFYIKKHLKGENSSHDLSFHFLSSKNTIDWNQIQSLINQNDKSNFNLLIQQTNQTYDLYLSIANELNTDIWS